MFDALLRRLSGTAPTPLPPPGARLALAALMVHLARADHHYAEAEARQIDRLLAARFGLSPFEAARLRGEGEALEQGAADTVRFTRAIKDHVPLEDRAGVLQALWTVVLSDGARDPAEDRTMRLVASLLGLTDVESALARQRAERGA